MKHLIFAFALAATVGCVDNEERAPVSETTQELTDATVLMNEIDSAVARTKIATANGDNWLKEETLANIYVTRARLTGSVDDYVQAGNAIDRAFEISSEGTGPFLSRAGYAFLIHRVTQTSSDLDQAEQKIIIKKDERAAIVGLRGDVSFHTADLDAALEHYTLAESLLPDMASAARLGQYALRTGAYEEAGEWYEEAVARTDDPYQKSWALLHRGIVELERDRVEDAMVWYLRADEAFSGWYLIEEHIAEGKLLTGDLDGAIEIYESVLSRVPNGEFYAALSETLMEAGEEAKSIEMRDAAFEAFDRDIAVLESAASGHAIDFFIAEDPKRAVVLAERNFESRPGFAARVLLARALHASGESDAAREALAPMLDSKWATPDFHDIRDALYP